MQANRLLRELGNSMFACAQMLNRRVFMHDALQVSIRYTYQVGASWPWLVRLLLARLISL